MIDYKRKNLARIVKIDDVRAHSNADRLDIITVGGWQCVAKKGEFKPNDLALYFEIDSILPEEVEGKIFGKDAKVKLKNARVKTIKLRGEISQGLIVPTSIFNIKSPKVGDDCTQTLGIGKYVPSPKSNSVMNVNPRKKTKREENIYFKKVRKPEHIQNAKTLFEGHDIVITEKLHGTNAVSGWIKRNDISLLDKFKCLIFGKYEFCFRSHNVQLQGKTTILERLSLKKTWDGFYDDNVYAKMVKQYDLKNKIPKGYELTYEIIGYGIQKNYHYGIPDGEQRIACFGVRRDGLNIPFKEAYKFCESINIPYTPVLYKGMFEWSKVMDVTDGKSIYDPKTKIREGCCIERADGIGGVLKSVSKKYLLKNNSEYK